MEKLYFERNYKKLSLPVLRNEFYKWKQVRTHFIISNFILLSPIFLRRN